MGGKEFKMKKLVVLTMVVVVVVGMFCWWLTPVAPHHYTLHVVRGGETLNSIIVDANKDSSVDYDIREATAVAVAESRKMEEGITGYTIRPGQKVAVPIYR